MRYRFEHCGNPDYVEVHVDIEILDTNFMHAPYGSPTEHDKLLWEWMQGIPGVTDIFLHKYSISASRRACFSKAAIARCPECIAEEEREMARDLQINETTEY